MTAAGIAVPHEARPWVERLARAGYAAKGAVYLTIGVLALQTAAGSGGGLTDSDGVLRILLRQPYGKLLLGLAAIGLFGYALWRALCAAVDPEGRHEGGAKRIAARAGYAVTALVHGGLAWQAAQLAMRGSADRGRSPDDWTATLMQAPAGRWLVGAAALALAGYGLVQLVKGVQGDVQKRLGLGTVDPDHRRVIITAARAGLISRGIVFMIIGSFLVRAALEYDPSEAGGVREALVAIERQPYAPYLLGAIALGLAAYGAFQLVKARYRVITPA